MRRAIRSKQAHTRQSGELGYAYTFCMKNRAQQARTGTLLSCLCSYQTHMRLSDLSASYVFFSNLSKLFPLSKTCDVKTAHNTARCYARSKGTKHEQ